jgi:hypothetical protein
MPNAFSEMVKCIKSDTQMVVSKIIWYKPHTFLKGVIANLFNKNFTLKKYIHKCDYGYIWNKLYNLNFIKKNELFFFERIRMLEDLFISAQLLQNNPKIAFCTKHTYHYTKGNNMSLNISDEDCQNFIKLYKWISSNIKNDELVTNFFLTCKVILRYIKKTKYIAQLENIHKPSTKKLTWWRKIAA